MIHPKSKVTWLDQTEAGISYTGTLDELFQKYAYRVHDIGRDISVIAFGAENGPKIQIQDWTGWTNVMTIWKNTGIGREWIDISVVGHPDMSIMISEYELAPMYDPEDTRRGFHGEIKYAYKLKHPERILTTDTMRVRNVEDIFPEHPQFARISVKHSDDATDHGYQIYTLSTFMSANGFHLYASDEVDVNLLMEKGHGYK